MTFHPSLETHPRADPVEWLEQLAATIAVIGSATILGIFAGAILELPLQDPTELPLRLFFGIVAGSLVAIWWAIAGRSWMGSSESRG
jgi:hypothetical protein